MTELAADDDVTGRHMAYAVIVTKSAEIAFPADMSI